MDSDVATLVDHIHHLYAKTKYKPSTPHQFTILAAFALNLADSSESSSWKVISLATGAKCLPTLRFPVAGDALHDSHAEVLARRGAVSWFYREIQRCAAGHKSTWIETHPNRPTWRLTPGVALYMYVSTLPCGDASTRFLAHTQDPTTAASMSLVTFSPLPPTSASRGRTDFSRLGALRTKPSRADAPPTMCMTCADKMALWSVVGVQGALASVLLEPVYIYAVVIGDVQEELRDVVRGDCERAWRDRLGTVDGLQEPYSLRTPEIHFTPKPFVYSRNSLEAQSPHFPPASASNESLCWIADTPNSHEVLAGGIRRGVSAKNRSRPAHRPQLCKASLFALHLDTLSTLDRPLPPEDMTYFDLKHIAFTNGYQHAKDALRGKGRVFEGWIVSGRPWESFDMRGVLHPSENPAVDGN
ncbi:adenosine deaminase/editase [Rickenella mellea]|uniref:Adenosine deaminase/editase n=1 Tax=Rickenella mellea TaxID=50990 RepID=A0A4R5XF47_9AGAM|nr:adenosine deaminase/editase [Rickenella mellea]